MVGVIGTQNTGKSTFIGDIISAFEGTLNEFHTGGCDYREKIRKAGLQINRKGNLEAQKIILDTLIEQMDIIKQMPNGNYITDRSPIDAYVYTVYLFRHNPELGIVQKDIDEMLAKVRKSIEGYDRIIYIDLDNCLNVEVVDDTLRDTNLEYRSEIDGIFKETLVLLGLIGTDKLNSEIKGTREMRVNQFLEMEGGHFFVGQRRD